MEIHWAYGAPSFMAAFLGSMVEFVEALTIVLAVGATRSWRGSIAGAGLGIAVLLAIIAALGPALTRVPIATAQLIVGALLLLFGLRWLRKSMLRYAGAIPLHDEAATYSREVASLRSYASARRPWDPVAVAASFKITMLEGIEVVFIVIAVGAGSRSLLIAASFGAAIALAVVVVLGLALHRPLSSIPENTLKFGVGVLLSAFGCFWVGEGIGVAWPGSDWAILELIVGFLAVATLTIPLCRRSAVHQPSSQDQ